MEYIHDGLLHDSLRAHYQTVEIVRLNSVLIDNDIDAEQRQKILETFFFDSGHFLDSGWFRADERRFAPGVYFEEVSADEKRTSKYHLPDTEIGTMFHEWSGGTVELLFDDDEDDDEVQDALYVEVGHVVQDEDPN